MGDLWTIRRMLQWSHGWLSQRGVDAPRLDGELLLAEAMGLRRLDLFLDPDRPLTEENLARFRELIRRRGKRESVAHILGHKGFWKLDLQVSPQMLVPRPESERVVEVALALVPPDQEGLQVLDVGVGSGALLLSLLSEWPQAVGVGVDLRQEAVRCARRNARTLNLAARCFFFQGDLLAGVSDTPSFHVIMSNPPYISQHEAQSLAPEVKEWEDSLTWYGGEDGLDVYRRLLPQALTRLKPGGLLLVEIGASQGAAVVALAVEAGYGEVEIWQDYARRDRVVTAKREVIL